jgi:hypothetical protein
MEKESSPLQTKKDIADAFVLYTVFLGDAVKTAHALNVSPEAIVNVAEEQGWNEKVGQLAELRKSDKPGDLERAINRAVNFAQAHRTRQQLERAIEMIENWSQEELESNLMMPIVDKKTGSISYNFSARPLADLTAALEKAHTLTYLSLGDTAQDRARRKEETTDSVIAASAMHKQIAEGMAQVGREHSAKTKLLGAQLEQANRLAVDKKPKAKAEPETINIPPLKEGE